MAVGGEDKHYHLGVVDFVYQAVFLCDTAALATFRVALELLWVTGAGCRMVNQFE